MARDDDDRRRPRKVRRSESEDDEDERPKSNRKKDTEDDDEDERPRRRSRDNDEDEVRPRKKKKRKTQGGFSLIDAIPMPYSVQINLGILLGLVMNALGMLVLKQLWFVLLPLAMVFWYWGCSAYAKNKGYNELLGLLGFLSLCGLIVLVILPDRNRS